MFFYSRTFLTIIPGAIIVPLMDVKMAGLIFGEKHGEKLVLIVFIIANTCGFTSILTLLLQSLLSVKKNITTIPKTNPPLLTKYSQTIT